MLRSAAFSLLAVLAVILAILASLGFGLSDIQRLFAHPISGGQSAAVGLPPAQPQTAAVAALKTADFAVIIAYLTLMVIIGLIIGKKVKTTRRFFLADGNANFVLVGMSLLATYLSALTMMALPGMSFSRHDLTYVIQLPCLVITAAVITGLVLPRYRAAGVVSVYHFLEQRIHVSLRLVAAVSFLIFAIGRMGLVLYLPALAFNTVSGLPLEPIIVGMGVVITLYTMAGGIEAVIWTDVVQAVIFILGALLSLAYVFADVGVERFLAIGEAAHKFRWFIPGADLAKITSLWLVLETLFQTIRIYGTEQDLAQRYMTTSSTERANRSVWISILLYIPLGFIFYFLGVALFAYYRAYPEVGVPFDKPDRIYPYFIVHRLPAGMAGFVVAAIFAAAMSTISSLMNSASAVCVEDFLKRLGRTRRSDREHLWWAKGLTLLWGALHILIALLFMEIAFAQIVWQKLMGICTNGILGLLVLALLPWRLRPAAVVTGFVLSYEVLAILIYFDDVICFLLWPIIGNTTCVLGALVFHWLFELSAKLRGGK